jgi:hypothetical protein
VSGTPARDAAARYPLPPSLLRDLRTPLAQMIGYTELLLQSAEEAGDPASVPGLGKVSAAGHRMLALLEDNFAPAPAEVAAPPAGQSHDAGGTSAPERRGGALAQFIVSNREPIMAEWEAFARTCTPASGAMDIVALRDHASEMLTVIADDLDTWQSGRERSEKSKGNAPAAGGAPTAAEEHGAGRAESGFTMEQMGRSTAPCAPA